MALDNMQAYGPFQQMVEKGSMTIFTENINKENHGLYLDSLLNILRDGIELEEVQRMYIDVQFSDGVKLKLTIMDFLYNLYLWNLPISFNEKIASKHLYFEETGNTADSIKKYLDVFIDSYRGTVENKLINNILDDTLYYISTTDEFSLWLLNTINNEDTITLMNKDQSFYDAIHADLSGVPLEDVKRVGMQLTDQAITAIKNSGFHALADSFEAREGISPKQFKEFIVNAGVKPRGDGQVHPYIINNSFANGGLQDAISIFIEDGIGRQAQIIQTDNVGDSGSFSRILGLNNNNTKLHDDPEYTCDTKNFIDIEIKDNTILNKYKYRWFREQENGVWKNLTGNPADKYSYLIGKTITVRSPMTCASKSRGDGICYKCYGDLAYTNKDINIGKIAAELLCSFLTQLLLSAKHLLESSIKTLKWSPGFEEIFDVQYNILQIKDDLVDNVKKYFLVINPDNIYKEDEIDEFDYNDYVTSFDIIHPNGDTVSIYTEDMSNIYLSSDILDIIPKYTSGGEIKIPLDQLKDMNLFLVHIMNNELSRTLKHLENLLNKIDEVKKRDKNSMIQDFIEAAIEGGIRIDAIHAEVILSNQIRSADDILEYPQWEFPNEEYRLLALSHSLSKNPSVTVSMEYQDLPRLLYNPLTFKKRRSSPTDYFFMVQPQKFMKDVEIEDSMLLSDKEVDSTDAFEYEVGGLAWKLTHPTETEILKNLNMIEEGEL